MLSAKHDVAIPTEALIPTDCSISRDNVTKYSHHEFLKVVTEDQMTILKLTPNYHAHISVS